MTGTIVAGWIIVAGMFGILVGLVLGLFLGERGRRKDLMWYTQQSQRPKDLDQPAEFEFRPDPEEEALRRAELQAMRQGIREELKRDGRSASEKDIEEEALRLVTQIDSEPAG